MILNSSDGERGITRGEVTRSKELTKGIQSQTDTKQCSGIIYIFDSDLV